VYVQLRSRVANVSNRAGQFVTEDEVKILLNGDADVYKPNGEPLVFLRRGAISKDVCEAAYPALYELRKYTTRNRGRYGGASARKSGSTVTEDGKAINVASAVVGYYDRQGGRFPFCRETAFVGQESEKWATIMPMVRRAAELFEEEVPLRYAKQMEMAAKTHPAYVITGTPFTTLTVNNSVVGSIHTDVGDYKDGIGVISVVRRGVYKGGWLVFPEFGVGADLQDGDLLFFNSHDWHGVTPFHDTEEGFNRVSVVYYFREKMLECLAPEEELKRVRTHHEKVL
jgi:hypothetical protein